MLKRRDCQPSSPNQAWFLKVWRREAQKESVARCAPPRKDWGMEARPGEASSPQRSPEAGAPRTMGMCPLGEGCEKYTVQSLPPLVFQGPVVSNKVLHIRLPLAMFQDNEHLTSPPRKPGVKISAPFGEIGSVETTAKYSISLWVGAFFLAQSQELALRHRNVVIAHLQSLGLRLNAKYSL